MNTEVTCFKDRRDAGRLLSAALEQYARRSDVIVIGLPRGGVPVAFEVARVLRAPLDVIVVRKLGVPGEQELAMGAISSGGVRVLNDDVIQSARITHAEIEAATTRESSELHRREIAWRGCTGPPDVTGKTVLLIDDGIATGSTVQAAAKALRAQDLTAIIIGVPVISAGAFEMLNPEVDDLVALMIPNNFTSVGQWYGDFSQISDDCVSALLAEAAPKGSPDPIPGSAA